MYSIWDDVEKGEEVWRIEFSFDRKLLRGFGVESFESFFLVAGDIWRYLTEDWLSQRELDNENQTRRTPSLLWEGAFRSNGTENRVKDLKSVLLT